MTFVKCLDCSKRVRMRDAKPSEKSFRWRCAECNGGRVLYALWSPYECLANLLAAPGLNAAQVRALALAEHNRVPLSAGTGRTPYEHGQAIRRASVKVYDRDRSTGRRIE